MSPRVDLELTAADRDVNAGQDPENLTLGRFLLDVSDRHGPHEAIVWQEQRFSYARLRERVLALARGLVGAGVVKGARVGLLMSNRPEWIEAFYAAGMIGAVLVPVNTFAVGAERDFILRHGDVSVLLLERNLLKRDYLEELEADHAEFADDAHGAIRSAALPQLRQVFCLGPVGSREWARSWDELLELGRDIELDLITALRDEVRPSDDALILYTSGSTASPKGVLHAQRTAVLQSWRLAQHMRLEREDRVWSAQPFFWSAGLAMSLGATFAAGATLLLQPHFDPGAGLELMERERATVVHAWPHQHQALFEHPGARRRDLGSLTKVVGYSALRQLLGIPDAAWGSGPSSNYGMTETFTLAASIPHDAPHELRLRSRGLPIPGMEIRITDPQTGRELPTGEPGEIALKGVLLMRGYYKQLPEQWRDDEGYFHTGDGGWLDAEGHLHWTGRLDDMIKTGGANVSPLEIEGALDGFEELRAARAIAVPHPTLGQAIVLCAVRAEGSDVGENEVRRFLRARLPGYKIPRRVLFFAPGELDLTSNQKIRVASLREVALERLAAERAQIEGHTYRA